MSSQSVLRRLPASQVLAGELRDAIESGELKPGDKLPSERALASEHGLARNTVREAVRLLSEQGLVTAEHGRGVFVRRPSKLMRFGQKRYSKALRDATGLSPYRAEVEAQGRVPKVNCVRVEHVPAPEDIAERLRVSVGDTVVRRENHYFADGKPMQIGVTWVPLDIVRDSLIASSTALGSGSLYARFEECGHAITSIREEISARTPSMEERKLLQMPEGVPLLEVMHTGYDQTDKPFEVTIFRLRADQNGLDYQMAVE